MHISLRHVLVELAFYKKGEGRLFTEPDFVFLVHAGINSSPFLMVRQASNSYPQKHIGASWRLYDERVYDGNNLAPYHHKILNICLLMIGIFLDFDKDLRLIAKSFCDEVFHPYNTMSIFDIYEFFTKDQLDLLLRYSHDSLAGKYRVLSFCREGIDIIQDIQQQTSGLLLEQFRYSEQLHHES